MKKNDLGLRIVTALEMSGLSRSELADKVGVTRGAASQWTAGQTQASTAKLSAIADATGVPLEWLATGRLYLREWREFRCLTIEEAASRIGTSDAAVMRWETGPRLFRMQTLTMFAEIYETSVADLMRPPGQKEGRSAPDPAGELATAILALAKAIEHHAEAMSRFTGNLFKDLQ